MHDLIQVDNGQLSTTSLLVAEKFGKQHGHVLRAIRSLECSPEFNRSNFGAIEYADSKGRSMPAYRISRDGFTMLAMGFTGAVAAKWREAFIGAFNAMERKLRSTAALHSDPLWQKFRLGGKVVRHDLTDTLRDFIEYAKGQGSTSAEKYYMIVTKMEYKALFMVGEAVGKDFRDRLTIRQTSYLTAAEAIAQKAFREGMAKGVHYKEIYQLAKLRVEAYSGLLGPTSPGDDKPVLLAA